MIAYRLLSPQQPPEFQDVPKPSPGPGQLLIKVGGCGLCHTDIALMGQTRAEFFDTPPPFTLGHEIAGWVAEIGQGVVGFKNGEPVAIVPVWRSCGHCPHAGIRRQTPQLTVLFLFILQRQMRNASQC